MQTEYRPVTPVALLIYAIAAIIGALGGLGIGILSCWVIRNFIAQSVGYFLPFC